MQLHKIYFFEFLSPDGQLGDGVKLKITPVMAHFLFSATLRIIWCLQHIFVYFNIFRIISRKFSQPAYFHKILIFVKGIIHQENFILQENCILNANLLSAGSLDILR